jgi:hypothetical protein
MTWGIESHVIERFGAAGIPADRIASAGTRSFFDSPQPTVRLLSGTSGTTTDRR